MSARFAARVLCVLFIWLGLAGCPVKPPSGVRLPITSGAHTTLPAADQRMLIWADPPLTEMAVEWLKAHHYSQLLMPEATPLQAHQMTHNFSSRDAAVTVAKEMRAAVVVVVERDAAKDGALIEPHCGARYHVTVELRGLSVDSGETTFRGSAHYPQCVDLTEETIRNLMCQALATAWGFRPSGQLEIPSSLMCTTGQTAPAPVR
ncbi:MAG TPA: hypothetical protein VFM24_08425 [Nitrospira sp.]|nr:hypothetical protein [Nitrospira sp.]